jgi:hypothetical protein
MGKKNRKKNNNKKGSGGGGAGGDENDSSYAATAATSPTSLASEDNNSSSMIFDDSGAATRDTKANDDTSTNKLHLATDRRQLLQNKPPDARYSANMTLFNRKRELEELKSKKLAQQKKKDLSDGASFDNAFVLGCAVFGEK